jgi:isoleucyl-tRNA synthetase
MFREVSSKLNLAEKEQHILDFWKEKSIFQKSLELRKDEKEFVFYEGPPTANGRPGIHHVISRTVKDIVCRYKSMKGFLVRRKAGWDTHGLPVEIEVEKQLHINGKEEIEKYGVENFNKKCKESVFNYKKEWDYLTERIAYWVDLENPYITFTNDYIETVWWILKEIWKKDLLYEGFKILPYCPRCETPISSHEVSQGYRDVKDPSIYVRMKRLDKENAYFLVWTTTPWTLISNVALAVGADIDYVEVESDEATYVMARDRLEDLFEAGSYKILKQMKGSELEGISYERLFDFVPVDKKAFYVISGDFVTTTDGTGIVHIAPAFGEDDYQAGLNYDLPLLRPVNESGKFEEVVEPYKNKFVKEADAQIIQDLREAHKLVKKVTIEHSYPHCWRCQTPLLYYARESWFIRTSRHKNDLQANNDKIKWYPPEVGSGRFGEWLKNNIDWSLSRDRYWGTPLNIWVCENCQTNTAIGSIAELREKGKDVPDDLDLHKPYVDRITMICESCAGTMHRVPEVIDCWFDSGSMPYAQYHYPFENKEQFEKNFPADFICEGIDQTRGWFYSLLAISTLLFNKPAYKNIVVNELILDKDGQKMSKSKGNVVVPEEIITRYGADTVRWYLITVSPPWTPKRFDEEGIKEVLRKFMNTLINTYSFFVLYANIDDFKAGKEKIDFRRRPEIDRWIVSKLYGIVEQSNQFMENYELTRTARMLSDFVIDDVSNWYVRRNRRRFWKSEDWKDKLSAYETLYEVLMTISRLIAPFTPFIAEDIYTNLKAETQPESVHLERFPVLSEEQKTLRDETLEQRMALVQNIVSISHSLRNESNVRVRQPLSRLLVYLKSEKERAELKKMTAIVCDELNIKSVEIVDSTDQLISRSAKPNFKILGPKVGKLMNKLAPVVQGFSNEQIAAIEKNGYERVSLEGQEIKVLIEDIEIRTESKEGYATYTDPDLTLALDLTLNDDLIEEGLARELINRVQNIRKESEFSVTDRIEIYLDGQSSQMAKAVKSKMNYIMSETLAVKITDRNGEQLNFKEITIGEESFLIGLKKNENVQEV